MIKRIGLSCLMAFTRPAMTAATNITPSAVAPKDNTRFQPISGIADMASVAGLVNEAEFPLLDVNFCGECMPLDQESVVTRWKHVFTTFKTHTGKIGGLRKRADAFFPVVDKILEEYNIPPDFRYIPLAESGLNPKAVSPKGAGGYWQLMPGTARELGLKVGGKTDERFNTRKATIAACRYLRKLYVQFGSWSLVAAAYNVGPGYIKGQLRRQANTDYYQMKLPRETRYYLYRVLLYKELLSRPDDYSTFLSPA